MCGVWWWMRRAENICAYANACNLLKPFAKEVCMPLNCQLIEKGKSRGTTKCSSHSAQVPIHCSTSSSSQRSQSKPCLPVQGIFVFQKHKSQVITRRGDLGQSTLKPTLYAENGDYVMYTGTCVLTSPYFNYLQYSAIQNSPHWVVGSDGAGNKGRPGGVGGRRRNTRKAGKNIKLNCIGRLFLSFSVIK